MTTPDAPIRAVLRRPFPEQIAAFRLRLGNLVPTETWDQLWQDAHDRAFTVAGATQADLLADLALAVDRAISQGTGLEAFRAEFREIVAERGWTGWTGEGSRSGQAWRTRVIYRTNMRTSYAAGRMAQLREAGFRYWIYRHGGSLEPRQAHLAIDGLILPSDHPFWDTWAPPNGWGCSCWIAGAHTLRVAKLQGGNPDVQLPDGWDDSAPDGIDAGWAYAPGGSASDTISLAARKIAALPPELGAALGASLDAVIDRHWPIWLAETQSGIRHEPALVGVLDASVQESLLGRGIAPASSEIVVRPGLVRGPKAQRHEAAGDALTSGQWQRLPALLRNPRAVLVDVRTGNLIYVVQDPEDETAQIAVRMDYRVQRERGGQTLNAVVSAYRAPLGNLVARLAGGLLELILGTLG